MNREEKAALVVELSDKFSKAKIAVAADYRGLKVAHFEELRRELKKNDSEIRVAKNTLLSRAVKGTSFETLDDTFAGTTVITFCYGDPIAPTKVLAQFVKAHPELVLRGGVLQGKSLSANDIIELSKLPSKEVLLSKLLGTMQAVPGSFVRVLAGVPQKLLYLLQALKDQHSENN